MKRSVAENEVSKRTRPKTSSRYREGDAKRIIQDSTMDRLVGKFDESKAHGGSEAQGSDNRTGSLEKGKGSPHATTGGSGSNGQHFGNPSEWYTNAQVSTPRGAGYWKGKFRNSFPSVKGPGKVSEDVDDRHRDGTCSHQGHFVRQCPYSHLRQSGASKEHKYGPTRQVIPRAVVEEECCCWMITQVF